MKIVKYIAIVLVLVLGFFLFEKKEPISYVPLLAEVTVIERWNENTKLYISTGSGLLLGDGFVLTNNHVVLKDFEYKVTINQKQYLGKVVYRDASKDVAILQIPDLDIDIQTNIFLSEDENIKKGDKVLLHTTSDRFISEVVEVWEKIKIDVILQEGDSGSVTQNAQGQIVGVNTEIDHTGTWITPITQGYIDAIFSALE